MAISIFLIFYFIKLQKTAEPVWGDLWWPFFYEMENEKKSSSYCSVTKIVLQNLATNSCNFYKKHEGLLVLVLAMVIEVIHQRSKLLYFVTTKVTTSSVLASTVQEFPHDLSSKNNHRVS